MKRWMVIPLVVLVVAAVAVAWVLLAPNPNVGNRAKLERTFSTSEKHTLDTVTVARSELSRATCTDGAHCWIAVDGVVYDMGVFPQWVRGLHHGVKAGQDDTAQFVSSGHGIAVLQKMPVVGRLGS